MAEENFMRRYVLRCGVMGQAGFEIGNVDFAAQEALHISFHVEKSDVSASNTAKVQIWNLSEDSLKVLDTRDCIVELRAGYGDGMALILVGTITSVDTVADGADRMTELEVVDGRVELRDTNISCSFNGVVDCRQMYEQIASRMGVPAVYAPDLSFLSIPNGFSFVGSAKQALQKIAQYCGHSWSIQNGVLQVTSPNQPVSTMGYVLDSGTGLIDIPKRITVGEESGSREAMTGWEVRYFLNGNIGINDTVYIKSREINGYFRVQKVTFEGDNLAGDWLCTAQVLELGAE